MLRMTFAHRYALCAFASALMQGGCDLQSGTTLELRRAIDASDQCAFEPSGPGNVSGFYDPTGTNGFVLAMGLVNHMDTEDDAPLLGATGNNIFGTTNNLELLGFDTCYFRPDSEFLAYESHGGGLVKDCDNLKNERGESLSVFVPSSGNVEAGGSEFVGMATVLTYGHLRRLFGRCFAPDSLRNDGIHAFIGAQDVAGANDGGADTACNTANAVQRFVNGSRNQLPYDSNDDGDLVDALDVLIDYAGPGPNFPNFDGTRAIEWGTYGVSRSTWVRVQLRAVAQLQTGKIVHSNWMAYSVDVCVGCVWATCGYAVAQWCPVCVFSDGVGGEVHAACPSSNICVETSLPCDVRKYFLGTPLGTASCNPFSGYGEVTCADAETCP